MKKLLLIVLIHVPCILYAQHFGGVFFSSDYVPSPKHPFEQSNSYFEDHNFSWGYTIGYQGLLFQQRRFSINYGLQYSYRPTYQENYGAPWGCSTGIDPYDYTPVRLEEVYRYIEIPIELRLNILKSNRLQPYLSLAIIPNYPIKYTAQLIDENGNTSESESLVDSFKYRADLSIAGGTGLNYRIQEYLLGIQIFARHMETLGKFGIGLSVMRKF